ncbi:MAG: flippase-like domain-containing protein [Ekhidna sp.]|nr:flippase-like domain-containing protein [Ekhidna sp.]
MSRRIIDVLKVLISTGLAAVLLYLVFRNIDWSDFLSKTKSVDYSWVVLSIMLSVLAYVARAYRWNIILAPLGFKLKTRRTLLAVIIGYLANLALPRLGEVTRCGVLKRNDDVPVATALGSVVTERIIDFLTLIFLFCLSLLWEFDRIVTFFSDAYASVELPAYFIYSIVIAGIVGFVAVVLIIRKRDQIGGKFGKILKAFFEGVLSLRDISNVRGFVLSTILLWVVYYFMSYIIIFSLPETSHLGIGVGFMLLVTGGIALSIPVQNGFGTYHGMIAAMLLLYGIDKTTGLFLATLLHTSQIVAVAVFGTVALIISASIGRKKQVQ